MTHIQEFATLWEMIDGVTLHLDRKDTISWRFTYSGQYTAPTAYMAQFAGLVLSNTAAITWKTWAPPKCKFFAWLVLHGRILTADMLAIRGWPHDPRCQLCLQQPETATHLCKDCPFAVVVWNQVNTWTNEGLAISGFCLSQALFLTGGTRC